MDYVVNKVPLTSSTLKLTTLKCWLFLTSLWCRSTLSRLSWQDVYGKLPSDFTTCVPIQQAEVPPFQTPYEAQRVVPKWSVVCFWNVVWDLLAKVRLKAEHHHPRACLFSSILQILTPIFSEVHANVSFSAASREILCLLLVADQQYATFSCMNRLYRNLFSS